MTDDLVPVPMRARHAVAGDEFVSRHDGLRYRVTSAGDDLWRIAGREMVAEQGRQVIASALDPDHVLDVLIPAVERDAVELLHAELGARLTGRRSTGQRSIDHGTV